ncbi:MAG: hypothetical protein KAJ23_11210 [Maribacter sp.]|nr:hypothetical protein [Maribacter sp.]
MDTRRGFLQKMTAIAASSLITDRTFAQTNGLKYNMGNPYGLSAEMVEWMREATIQQLKGCRVKAHDGTWIHSPDGVGNYKALWTRDFYYMVEYAGDLIDQEEIKASIHYLVNGQRDDGCMPDRVYASGEVIYSPGAPGKPLADHAVDNGPFMAMLLCSYVNQFDDKALFLELESKIRDGLAQIYVKENGLVYNDPKNPQCVYGFTDIVKKTGYLLFTSLLFYKANLEMYTLCQKYGFKESSYYKRSYEYVKQSIYRLWSEDDGMFWAADIDCKQIDIWGSAYAVEVGVTTPEQTQRIANFLVEHYDEYVQRGQIRHLTLSDGVWEKLFIEKEPGTYQNGAFWATSLAWIAPIYDKVKPGLTKRTLEDCIEDFQKNGINECIHGDYVKVPNFVVSATNVYGLTK